MHMMRKFSVPPKDATQCATDRKYTCHRKEKSVHTRVVPSRVEFNWPITLPSSWIFFVLPSPYITDTRSFVGTCNGINPFARRLFSVGCSMSLRSIESSMWLRHNQILWRRPTPLAVPSCPVEERRNAMHKIICVIETMRPRYGLPEDHGWILFWLFWVTTFGHTNQLTALPHTRDSIVVPENEGSKKTAWRNSRTSIAFGPTSLIFSLPWEGLGAFVWNSLTIMAESTRTFVSHASDDVNGFRLCIAWNRSPSLTRKCPNQRGIDKLCFTENIAISVGFWKQVPPVILSTVRLKGLLELKPLCVYTKFNWWNWKVLYQRITEAICEKRSHISWRDRGCWVPGTWGVQINGTLVLITWLHSVKVH